jgi:hypothetical protein
MPQLKMANYTGRPKNFFPPMRWGSMPPGGPRFFLSCGGEGGVVGLFLVVNAFPWSSKCVYSVRILNGFPICSPSSQWVPQHVLNSSLLYSISSALSSCNQPQGGDYTISILVKFRTKKMQVLGDYLFFEKKHMFYNYYPPIYEWGD